MKVPDEPELVDYYQKVRRKNFNENTKDLNWPFQVGGVVFQKR